MVEEHGHIELKEVVIIHRKMLGYILMDVLVIFWRDFINIYVNDVDIRYRDGMLTPLKDGDRIQIVPSIEGGIDLKKPPAEQNNYETEQRRSHTLQ